MLISTCFDRKYPPLPSPVSCNRDLESFSAPYLVTSHAEALEKPCYEDHTCQQEGPGLAEGLYLFEDGFRLSRHRGYRVAVRKANPYDPVGYFHVLLAERSSAFAPKDLAYTILIESAATVSLSYELTYASCDPLAVLAIHGRRLMTSW